MLLRLDPQPPFDSPRTKRLLALEAQFRRSSEGRLALREYRAILKNLDIEIPRSTRTLQEDLRRYAAYCDDVIYGEYRKSVQLDPFASHDAVAWLLGHPWREAPLQPHLSSSCLRCLLLAHATQAEIQLQYHRVRQPQEPWTPEVLTGIPLRFMPGADAGYMQLHLVDGRLAQCNLAWVEQFVHLTGQATEHYAPLAPPRQYAIVVEMQDVERLERLCRQFPGFTKQRAQCGVMHVEASCVALTLEVLEAHLRWPQPGLHRELPSAPWTLHINEDSVLHCQEV